MREGECVREKTMKCTFVSLSCWGRCVIHPDNGIREIHWSFVVVGWWQNKSIRFNCREEIEEGDSLVLVAINWTTLSYGDYLLFSCLAVSLPVCGLINVAVTMSWHRVSQMKMENPN